MMKNPSDPADRHRRKPRIDKGSIQATQRDLYCIAWIAEQQIARFDQIQRLLSRFPDPDRPFADGDLIADTTTRDHISRWRRAGWISYERFLAGDRGYAWVTRRGLQLVGLDDVFRIARPPAATRLHHLYAINQVRLWMDVEIAGLNWTSERRYRALYLEKKKGEKGESSGSVPDALIRGEDIGKTAIEVEISIKKPDILLAKLNALVRAYHFDVEIGNYAKQFPFIWFYVPNERIKRAVEQARKKLDEASQGRISVVIDADLLA